MQATQQAALIELGQAALVDTDLSVLMRQAVERVAQALEVEFCQILELLPDGRTLVLREGFGWQADAGGQATEVLSCRSPAAESLLTHQPIMVEDWECESRFGQRSWPCPHGMGASLCVGMYRKHSPFGVLEVVSRQPRSFGDDDVQFLQAVADLLATAAERLRVDAALRESEARFRRLAENAADILYQYRWDPTAGFDYVSPAAATITGYTLAEFYSDPELAVRLVHPADQPRLEAALRSPGQWRNPLQIRLVCKDATVVWTEQQIVPLLDPGGQLVGVEGIVRDITERVHAYQTLEQRVEERTREIERRHQVAQGLHEILTIVNSNQSLDEILDFIIAQACQLLGTSVGAIYRYRPETALSIRAACGLNANADTLDLAVAYRAVATAVATRQAVVVADRALTRSAHWAHAPIPLLGDETDPACSGALLAVPLLIKDETYGAIALFYPEPRAFSNEEVRLATMLSDQAALAIENARLVTAAQGKAILEERQRLARDLHDSVTQAVYGITLYAEAASRLLASGDHSTVATYLCELQQTAREALQEMRLLIFELRPPVLEAEGLVGALRTRLEAVEGRSYLTMSLVVEGERVLPAPLEDALYRIAQEVLNNILRHAHASHVTLLLRREQTVELEIGDDGIGFDPDAVTQNGGFGLRGIAERVLQLGGNLVVESAPGTGTLVRVEVPQ